MLMSWPLGGLDNLEISLIQWAFRRKPVADRLSPVPSVLHRKLKVDQYRTFFLIYISVLRT